MKSHIFFDVSQTISGFQQSLGMSDALVHLRKQFRIYLRGIDGIDLKRLAKIVEIEYFLTRKPTQLGATAQFNPHQPFGTEAIQRFTHR